MARTAASICSSVRYSQSCDAVAYSIPASITEVAPSADGFAAEVDVAAVSPAVGVPVPGVRRRCAAGNGEHSGQEPDDEGHDGCGDESLGAHERAAWNNRLTAVGAIPARIAPTTPPRARDLPRDAPP